MLLRNWCACNMGLTCVGCELKTVLEKGAPGCRDIPSGLSADDADPRWLPAGDRRGTIYRLHMRGVKLPAHIRQGLPGDC